MKKTELRIGNFVNRNGLMIVNSISGLHGISMYDTINNVDTRTFPLDEFINPIPLTEEWMDRLGFSKVEMMFENIPMKRFNSINKKFFLTKGEGKFFLYLFNDREEELFNEIMYVHQLQNIYFFLTGIELIQK